jgi:iron complex transport system substrate-binding protein
MPIANSYARHFQVLSRGDERLVIVLGSNADTLGIYQVGFPVEGMQRGPGLALPTLERIAVVSSTHLAYIKVLEGLGKVVGVAGADRVRDRSAVKLIEAGSIVEIGAADGVDRELLLGTRAQALFDYPFGRSSRHASVDDVARIEVTEYLEEHPLGRAEWVRFFGVLLRREHEADSLFNAIKMRYMLVAENASQHAHRPRVFFGSHWQGDWHVPPGNSYMATLITDAGGDYCFVDAQAQGNIAVDLEKVITEGGKADRFGVVIANGGVLSADAIAGGDPRIASLPVLASGGFGLDSERGDIFGQALLEPDIMLQELACRIHPSRCTSEAPKYVFAVGQ